MAWRTTSRQSAKMQFPSCFNTLVWVFVAADKNANTPKWMRDNLIWSFLTHHGTPRVILELWIRWVITKASSNQRCYQLSPVATCWSPTMSPPWKKPALKNSFTVRRESRTPHSGFGVHQRGGGLPQPRRAVASEDGLDNPSSVESPSFQCGNHLEPVPSESCG